MEEPRARRWCLAFLLLALLLAGLFLWSLNAGSLPLTPCEVWDILVRQEGKRGYSACQRHLNHK